MNSKYSQVALIIPAYEPDEKMIMLLDKLVGMGIDKILLVDDGSGAGYEHLFEEAPEHIPCEIFRHVVNLGKGRALKDAFNYSLSIWPDIIGAVTADSDGQHSPEDIAACMEALINNPEALILGVRTFDGDDVPARSKFGNKTTATVFKLMMGIKVSDTQTGLRGIPASFMKTLIKVSGERYEFETNMLLETKQQGIKIIEIPIKTIYIEENATSHFRPLKDSVRIYALFFKYLISSLLSSIIDLGLFTLFCGLLKGLSLPISYILLSTALARAISAVVNYFVNLKVVFASKSNIKSSAWKYALLATIQLCASGILVNMIYPHVGGLETLIKLPVDTILFLINYVVQREIVYRDKK